MIGLFRELDAQLSQNLNSIHDFAWGLSSDIADIIFEYLINGVPVFDVMGVTVDPFDGTIIITGGPSLVSDGEWIWRSDLSYFVKKYRVKFPDEFIAYVLQRKSAPCNRDEILENWQEILDAYERVEQGGMT